MKEKYVFFGLSVMSMFCAVMGLYFLSVCDDPALVQTWKNKVVLYFVMSAGLMILYLRSGKNENKDNDSNGQIA